MRIKELCLGYRQKYGWEMPSLKLARIVYEENKETFNSVDSARAALRRLEGKAGSDQHKVKDVPERPKNPYSLPESEERDWSPFHIDARRVLVMSDIHLPFHSGPAIECALSYAEKEKPDAILLNGDILDFFQLSRFVRDPKGRSIAHELAAFKRLFEALKSIFNVPIYYKLGNHEERYQHYLWMKAHELDGVEEFELGNILKARAEGIEIIKDRRIIRLGDLNVLHGHEFGQSIFSPVNIARGLYLRGKVSAMQGHSHVTSEHTEPDMNGNIITTWSVGCLCNLNPQWNPINRWCHGFAIVDIDGSDFHVRNKRIHKGKVL
jgi:predicted phosphodiesterase